MEALHENHVSYHQHQFREDGHLSPGRGAAYKAWQKRWARERVDKRWEWSTVPAAMGRKAIQALADDCVAGYKHPVTAVLQWLTVIASEQPPEQRRTTLKFTDEKASEHAELSFIMGPAVAEKKDEAAVALTVQAETQTDVQKLKKLGICNEARSVDKEVAMGFIDSAAKKEKETEACYPDWSDESVQAALVTVEKQWPQVPSPYQAILVVAGWVLYRSMKNQGAGDSTCSLCDITFEGDVEAPQDAHLRLKLHTDSGQ